MQCLSALHFLFMSKLYLTEQQTNTKLGVINSSGGGNFSTKKFIIDTNLADESKLTNYSNFQYVLDDDIIKKQEFITVTQCKMNPIVSSNIEFLNTTQLYIYKYNESEVVNQFPLTLGVSAAYQISIIAPVATFTFNAVNNYTVGQGGITEDAINLLITAYYAFPKAGLSIGSKIGFNIELYLKNDNIKRICRIEFTIR